MSALRHRIAVVGGGVTGLAAAQRLVASDANVEITLFEAAEKLGGVLQTEEADGFCLELGPDSMLSRMPWGIELCKQIGLADELISTSDTNRGVHVVRRGRLQRVPDGLAVMAPERIWPFVTTPILSWRAKLRLAMEPFVPRRNASDDESLADFTRRRLGRETFDRLVQPLASGIFMGDPERLSIRAGFPQFHQMEANHGSLVRASRAAKAAASGSDSKGGPQYSLFVAPRRGAGQLVERLADRLTDCRVLCGCRIENLKRDADGDWRAEYLEAATGEQRVEKFDGIVVALPAHAAAALLEGVDQELSELLGGIHYASCMVVNVAYRPEEIDHPLDSFGFVTPHIEDRLVTACTFSSVKYAERAPEGKVLLRAFLGGDCSPHVMQWSDEKIVGVVEQELSGLLGIRVPPLLTRIQRWRRAMPQYRLGHLDRVSRIDQLAGALPGLELAGNAYQGAGIPQCIRSGQAASDRLVAAIRDLRPQSSSQLKDPAHVSG